QGDVEDGFGHWRTPVSLRRYAAEALPGKDEISHAGWRLKHTARQERCSCRAVPNRIDQGSSCQSGRSARIAAGRSQVEVRTTYLPEAEASWTACMTSSACMAT